MTHLRAGLVSGLIAVLMTSALNIICRFLGLLPDQLDLKNMVLVIVPAASPIAAFWIGLILHIAAGIIAGVVFVLLVKHPTPLKGIGFTLAAVWLGMMLIIFPLAGWGVFGQNIGLMMSVATFVLNVFYGFIVGAFAQRLVVNVDDFSVNIGRALTQALENAVVAEGKDGVYSFDVASKQMVIFSDLHKGARDRADDFQIAEQTYNAALGYYYTMGHTLVALGDVEELWEERINTVVKSYEYTLKLEAKFHQDNRYLRFWGNHDDDWSHPNLVQQHLDPIYGAPLTVREGLLIRLTDAGQPLGTLFMVHGHQGTVDSDRLAFLSKPLVRFLWKPFQNLTGISLNTPSKNWQLRDQHNRAMYEWASKQETMIFVVGHTHRPVFLSRLHAAKIRDELEQGEIALSANPHDPDLRKCVALRSAELEWVLSQERQMPGPEGTTLPSKPCHFNTGCCCFYDGDITGIEIANGEILLIRWPDDTGAPSPKILERAVLKEVFAAL
jgi:hypothetical protein